MTKIIVALSKGTYVKLLNEDKKNRARKDPPHHSKDDYHAHRQIAGGYEIAYTIKGSKKHFNKFPPKNKIPKRAKQDIADKLDIPVDMLEEYNIYDENREQVVLLEKRSRLEKYLEYLKVK